MKRTNQKNSRPKNPNKEMGDISAKLRFGPVLSAQAAYKFKSNSNHQWVLKNFSKFFANINFRNAVMAKPFPKSAVEILSSDRLIAPRNYLSEIYWACSICSQFPQELSQFVILKNRFENSVLLGKHEDVDLILTEVSERFGYSIWYIQNYLLKLQDVSGLDEQKRLAKKFSSALGSHSITAWLIHFISKRAEGNSLKDGLKQETENFLSAYKENPAFMSYFKSKINNLPYVQVTEMAGILFFEASSSLIDLYESLVVIIQSIASDTMAPDDVKETLAIAIAHLYERVSDPRLNNVLRGLGSIVRLQTGELEKDRGAAIDSYTVGKYEDCVEKALNILKREPNDICLIKILAKAASNLPEPIDKFDGPLYDVLSHAIKIAKSSEDAYFSAYTLMTMASKYYSHSWAMQVKIMVHEMLSPVEQEFPSELERHLYIHAVKTSPFAALAFDKKAQSQFMADVTSTAASPITLLLIRALVSGEAIADPADFRFQKYLGRVRLRQGQTEQAKDIFSRIVDTATGHSRIEAGLYLSLCHIISTEVEDAVASTVDVYLEQPGIVSKIPYENLSFLLDDPRIWTKSIAIPIFFDLYSSYHKKDRDSHLRYSFECFQLKNELSAPTDLVNKLDSFGEKRVIQYLNKVCQPDVMRQTLIYEGTKEVEDERIRICRVLSDLDPSHSSVYVDEVRERVKSQEIISGLAVVEQSLVYVDINSITKSLKSRLKDSYSKYKVLANTSRCGGSDFSELFEVIKGGSSRFDTYILFPSKNDEGNSIYEVMFREVTNEFLKSDHGLNAFISTRIRHGKLRNLLRKSVEEENLVTSRKKDSSIYHRNAIWDLMFAALTASMREKLLDCLDRFSKQFDEKISYILDVLLRIQVENREGEYSNTNAWFLYRTSGLEITLMKLDANDDESLEVFIDRCIELLWHKTDANLAVARDAITGYLKKEFLEIFDSFSRNILEIADREDIQHLLDAIARARNNTQTKLKVAANWFNRSVVYDRPDYAIDIVVNIAVVIINNIRSGLLKDFSKYINLQVLTDSPMIGRTLDGLVDLFGILFENAIDHCELDINDLYVDVVLAYKSGELHITMMNNVASTVASASAQELLDGIKATLGKDGARKFLQAEGKSGFHKIWKILSGPVYTRPHLEFRYDGTDRFLVDIKVIVDA